MPTKRNEINYHFKNIKKKHEIAACKRFLTLYNLVENTNINFQRLGNPDSNEPDCMCIDNISIELTGVYDNQYQSEKIWSEARGKDFCKSPDYKLLTIDNLTEEIGKKLEKLNAGNYQNALSRIFLVCNLQSPLIEDTEVENYVSEHTPFRIDRFFDNYFDQIWISWRSACSGKWRIKRLE